MPRHYSDDALAPGGGTVRPRGRRVRPGFAGGGATKTKKMGYAHGGSIPTAGNPGPSKKQHNVPLKKGGGMKKVEPGYKMPDGNAQSTQGGFTGRP